MSLASGHQIPFLQLLSVSDPSSPCSTFPLFLGMGCCGAPHTFPLSNCQLPCAPEALGLLSQGLLPDSQRFLQPIILTLLFSLLFSRHSWLHYFVTYFPNHLPLLSASSALLFQTKLKIAAFPAILLGEEMLP